MKPQRLATSVVLVVASALFAILYLLAHPTDAAPRSAVLTAVSSPDVDVRPGSPGPSAPATDSPSSPLSGAPPSGADDSMGSSYCLRATACDPFNGRERPRHRPASRDVPSDRVGAETAEGGAPHPPGGASGISQGVASYYPARGDVASVPWWEAGMDPVWANVTHFRDGQAFAVTVLIVGKCQCYVGTPDERAIDLSDDAFRQLAPLSRGLIVVTIEIGTQGPVLPSTDAPDQHPEDPPEHPDDARMRLEVRD